MLDVTERELRAAKVACVLAGAVRAGEVAAPDALRILRHELRRLNTGKAETILVRSTEAQRVIDHYAAIGENRPKNGSGDALHADHVWPLTVDHLHSVATVEDWVATLRHLATVVCVTADENYTLMKVEKTHQGPEKYALAQVAFTTDNLPWDVGEESQPRAAPNPPARSRPRAAGSREADPVPLPSARSLVTLIAQAVAECGGYAERASIVERALDLGEFTPAQRAEPSRALRSKASHPSELHHRLGWAISHAKNAGLIEQVGPGLWRLRRRV